MVPALILTSRGTDEVSLSPSLVPFATLDLLEEFLRCVGVIRNLT